MIVGDPWDSTTTRFQVFTGPGAPFGRLFAGREHAPGIRDFTDGTSNTLLVAEVGASHAVPWGKPDDIALSAVPAWTPITDEEDEHLFPPDGPLVPSVPLISNDLAPIESAPFEATDGLDMV